jgi:hypothetical protein
MAVPAGTVATYAGNGGWIAWMGDTAYDDLDLSRVRMRRRRKGERVVFEEVG